MVNMGLEGSDHLAILFLISNSFNGFGLGLFLFAFGTGSSVVMGSTEGFNVCIAVGIVIVGLSFLGYCGAVSQNVKQINSYASAMVILTAAEIIHLVVLTKSPAINPNDIGLRAFCVTMIFIIVVSIMSILLAWTMSFRIRHARLLAELAEKRQPNLQP